MVDIGAIGATAGKRGTDSNGKNNTTHGEHPFGEWAFWIRQSTSRMRDVERGALVDQ
jgi:hypothetical protein